VRVFSFSNKQNLKKNEGKKKPNFFFTLSKQTGTKFPLM